MNKLLKELKPIFNLFRRYGLVIFIAIIGTVYGFIIITSGQLVAVEPSQHQIDEGYNGAKRPKLDKKIVEKINDLEDRNVKFQTIIDEARQNPFME